MNKPKVKQLEWHKTIQQFGDESFESVVYINKNIKHIYTIVKEGEMYVYAHERRCSLNVYNTLDEAKAAAQAHFENLILGCLENE